MIILINFIKKFFKVVLIMGVLLFIGYVYFQYKNNEVDDVKSEMRAQEESRLQEELLQREIQKAQSFVENINNDIALTILRTSGKVKLSHDKTPKNNKWTEWLFNSDIDVYANYSTAFTIEINDITSKIGDDASVTLTFDEDDIDVTFIDLTDFYTSTNKSIFGSAYTPSQVAAFEQIARDTIYEKTKTEDNLKQSKINLVNYFTTLAKDYDVKVNVVEK